MLTNKVAPAVNLHNVRDLTLDVEAAIDGLFANQPRIDESQANARKRVSDAFAYAVKLIIQDVPPCPDRSAAIRKVREAFADANSAITHNGRY